MLSQIASLLSVLKQKRTALLPAGPYGQGYVIDCVMGVSSQCVIPIVSSVVVLKQDGVGTTNEEEGVVV